jgi:TolB-like protein
LPQYPHAVFISYASQDAAVAARIADLLRAAGIEVWFDQNELRGGDAWDSKIKKLIHDCALFIPVISAQTNARSEGYFRREWNLATRRMLDMAHDSAFLVPVAIDGVKEEEARVPEEFLRAQWTRLPDGAPSPAFAHRVAQLLAPDSAPVSTAHGTGTGAIGPITRPSGRGNPRKRLLAVAVTALLAILGGGVAWYYQRTSEAPDVKPAKSASLPDAPVTPHEKSIAVLPFADMSPAKDHEYMSDGIAEEILNTLAQVSDLKVIARTSSFAFKGQQAEIAEIAKRLNVAHVLEGSVRTAGDQVRITAQLIRAADSTHLWSDTYDRPLKNVFSVQEEIANAIAQALQIRLMGGKLKRPDGGTHNLEAYKLYLQAYQAQLRTTRSALDSAERYLNEAIKLDPGFGLAWQLLADNFILMVDSGFLSPSEGYERARQLARKSLEVSPRHVRAHASLMAVHLSFDWDWAAANAEREQAIAIDPNDIFLLNNSGQLALALGQWNDAVRLLRAAQERDPLDTIVAWNLGHAFYRAGRFTESEAAFRRLLEIDPNYPWGHASLGRTLLFLERPDEGLALVQAEPDREVQLVYLPVLLHATGRQPEADKALEAQIREWSDRGAYYIAETYAYLGDRDRAMQWLERAYRQKDPALLDILGSPMFAGMADDPRLAAFRRKMNLPQQESLP